MKLKEMILNYRDNGQRVDEVLYQTVIEHIERAQDLEEVLSAPKLNLWSRVQNERLRANRLQAYVDEHSKKSVELNVFLQNRKTNSSLGMHVIDAVMKYVQELERKVDTKTLEETKNEKIN